MQISSLSGANAAAQSANIKKADDRLQAVLRSLVEGNNGDTAQVAVAAQLQSQTLGLKQLSNNLAQGISLTQVADGGIAQIQSTVEQLRNLAQQAQSPTLNDQTRSQLNQQFRQLLTQIDTLAQSTTFNEKSLLDGSISGDNALSLDALLAQEGESSGNNLSINDLRSRSLLGGQNIDITSSTGAGEAVSVLNGALNRLTSARAEAGSFQQTLEFAAANIDSAIINQQAAQSTLSDTDLSEASTEQSLADVQRNAAFALAAQTNKLTPTLLKLIG